MRRRAPASAQLLGIGKHSSRTPARAFGVLSAKGYAARVTFYIGKDGRVLHVDREVKPGTHGAEVAARLAALGVARR